VRTPQRRVALGLLLCGTVALGLTGCSEETADPPEDLQSRLDNAKQSLDEAASIPFTMSTDELPSGAPGLLNADGVGTHDPAFEGEIQVSTIGTSVTADLISVDGMVYAKTGFVPDYLPVEPSDYGAPDPAAFFDRETGVSSFLTSTADLTSGEETRQGEEVLTTISGAIPGDKVQSLIPSADGDADFDVEYRLNDDDVLRGADITGPFYPDAEDVTYSLTLEPSDQVVEITPP